MSVIQLVFTGLYTSCVHDTQFLLLFFYRLSNLGCLSSILFLHTLMKRLFASSVAIVLTVSAVVPAFAYVIPTDYVRPSQREIEKTIQRSSDVRQTSNRITRFGIEERDRDLLNEMQHNDRSQTLLVQPQTFLQRAKMDRNLRNENRGLKRTGRYRILNRIRTSAPKNTRTIRKEADMSLLPPTLVQTGGMYGYDRPTRRDIRDNAYFSQVNNRDREILKEISESSR